ncbi:MAG: hypothetical protein ACM34D_04550 [Gemmatimonadota bacterium]
MRARAGRAREAGTRATAAALAALALAGCGHRSGRLDATWAGAEQGRMSGRAWAVWCREARVAVVTGMSGDTGVSLLIHPPDSLAAGRYPIVEPDTARRAAPAAAVGLRLLGRTAVVGYQGQSGTLTLERAASGRVSGRFEATAKIASALAGTVKLAGRFRSVRVTADGGDCPR